MRGAIAALAIVACTAWGATPEQESALREIEAFTAAQQKSDPLYRVVEADVLERVEQMVKTLPPGEWGSSVKRWYFAASERAHAEERAKVASAERAALLEIGGSDDQRWISRMDALQRDLEAGRLTPREHALRARASAVILFPDDRILVGLRERKVALASEYELGNITRAEYDARWAQARGQAFQITEARDAAAAADYRRREIAVEAMEAKIDAERSNSIWRGVSESLRDRRGVTCGAGPFGNTITCR